MKPEIPSPARAILGALLDQYEQPQRQRVARVRLAVQDQPAYFATEEVKPRQQTNAFLQTLAAQGVVKLHWRKWEEDHWLEAVDLVPAQAEVLYPLLQRTPRQTYEETLRQLLARQLPHAGWHAMFLDWAKAQLDAHRSVAPLALDDDDHNRDLLRALEALAQQAEPLLERTFSVRVFSDSKRFEALRGAVLSVLRHHALEAAMYRDADEADNALLRAYGLLRAPEYVPVAGPLLLSTHGVAIDLETFIPSVALSAGMIRQAQASASSATALVTIENSTSFNEFLGKRPVSVLLIFTGGFASPTVIQLLRMIRAAQPSLPFYHWGDMDAGGMRILAHLRQSVGEVKSVGMDRATFDGYRSYAQALTAHDQANLEKLRSVPQLADCSDLIETLLAAGQKLEQEAVPVETILKLGSESS